MTTLPHDLELALRAYDLKPDGGDEWRCNSPIRQGANSHSFRINAVTGEWYDHVSEDKGNFYKLREALGLPQPSSTLGQAADTLRTYRDLDEYARDHGITGDVLRAAGWEEKTTYQNRPGFPFATATCKRIRFVDGVKPKYKPMVTGAKPCWYGLKKAVGKASEWGAPAIVLCNGEVSTIVAQHYKIPAFAKTGGEGRIPDNLLDELKAAWTGQIIIALDCDDKGYKTSVEIATQLSGFAKPVIVDIEFTEHGDLADWCKLHTDTAAQALYTLASQVAKEAPFEAPKEIESRPTTATSALQVADDYNRRLDLNVVMTGTPIMIPFKSFHRLGGYAKVMFPGKVAAIVAPSGGGKTSFLETWGDWLNKAGNDGVWYGDEWTPAEYHARRIQRYGGATLEQIAMWELFKKEHRVGIPHEYRVGEPLSTEMEAKSMQIGNRIKEWRGQMTYFPGAARALDYVLEDASAQVSEMRGRGRSVTFAVFDYVQLFEPSMQDNTVNRHEYSLELIKRWTQENDIVSFVGSQVTKAASKDSKGGDKLIDSDSAQFIRDDKFNLFISLNIEYEVVLDENAKETRVRTNRAVANITKNSMGLTGQVPLVAGLDRFSWFEAKES